MHVDLILVPHDCAHRGVRMGAGPLHLVAAGLPAYLEQRGHRVETVVLDPPAEHWRSEIRTAFELASMLALQMRTSIARQRFPVVLAGNCMTSLGVTAGLGPRTGVLWCDAHGDFNTPETTLGGFLDGMSLATLTGRCWTTITRRIPDFAPVPEQAVMLVGARDLDPLEEEAIRGSALHRVAAGDIGADLGQRVRLALSGVEKLYLHVDLDVLDPSEGRVNSYAADDGVSVASLEAGLRSLAGRAAAVTISAYDPAYDRDGRIARAAFRILDASLPA